MSLIFLFILRFELDFASWLSVHSQDFSFLSCASWNPVHLYFIYTHRSQSVVEPGVLKRPEKVKSEEENMQPLLSLD